MDAGALGEKLGHYRLVDILGSGGMGVVYRAIDERLEREVAIKVLPASVAEDPSRLARFEREAKLLASLNHPHIATLYGLELHETTPFLVMELVEGETLAKKLLRGPLGLPAAVSIAQQICEALEHAHERGVVHRDLKPANITIDDNDCVKVLDFGLAKALSNDQTEHDLSMSPTRTTGLTTAAGAILGTAAYMSPEQARGRRLNQRADLWALGCLLYEMLTGRRAFSGQSVTDVLATIIYQEPDWEALPGNVPDGIERLLRRCLAKEARLRLRSAGDAWLELEELTVQAQGAAGSSTTRRLVPWLVAAVVGVAAVIVLAGRIGQRPATAPEPIQLQLAAPTGQRFRGLALSPDGKTVALEVQAGDVTWLARRSLASPELNEIPGTQGARHPFFSPDGSWLGFWADGALRRIPPDSSGESIIIAVTREPTTGVTWCTGDTVVYSTPDALGLWQVPATGGTPQPLLVPDPDQGDAFLFGPVAIPASRSVLFQAQSADAVHLDALGLDDGHRQRISANAELGMCSGNGWIFYISRRDRIISLEGAKFAADQLRFTGTAATLVEGFSWWSVNRLLAVSRSTIAFDASEQPQLELVWLTPEQEITPLPFGAGSWYHPRISPDGNRVAVCVASHEGFHLWVLDLVRHTRTRITYDGLTNIAPTWSPDGSRLAFTRVGAKFEIWSALADGSGDLRRLLDSTDRWLCSWSGVDSSVAVIRGQSSADEGSDIWVHPLDDPDGAYPLADTDAFESFPAFSPDGRWVAFTSDRTGRCEVYVVKADGSSPPARASQGGGWWPRWSHDNQELYFMQGCSGPGPVMDTMCQRLIRVAVSADAVPRFGAEETVTHNVALGGQLAPGYDVAADGRVLLCVQRSSETSRIRVIVNWEELLRRRLLSERP